MNLLRVLPGWLPAVGLVLAAVCPAPASPDGDVAADQVSQTSYIDFLDYWLYTHDGDNRGPSGPELPLARVNIYDLLESYALTVTLEPFDYSGSPYHNVVGTQLGTTYPDQEFVVGAHYDSVSNPGADDNGSGVALVLEAARIISQYDSAYTIRYVAFSMEEVGLVGSEAYVAAHYGDDILGTAVTEYGNGLTWMDPGWISASDHASFDAVGYEAVLLIEGEVWNNP